MTGIKMAKLDCATKIRRHFTSNDPHSMWKGIKCITDYSKKNAQCPSDPLLTNALNSFYACFKASNNTTTARLTPLPDGPQLSVTAEAHNEENKLPQGSRP